MMDTIFMDVSSFFANLDAIAFKSAKDLAQAARACTQLAWVNFRTHKAWDGARVDTNSS